MAASPKSTHAASLHLMCACLSTLHAAATSLVTDFKIFQDYLASENLQHEADLRIYRKGLKAELEVLQKAVNVRRSRQYSSHIDFDESLDTKYVQLVKTSNVPHYQLWWAVAKQCRGIRGMGRRLATYKEHKSERRKRGKKTQGNEVQVDIIAQDGQEWIKISSVTEKRLLLEIAKQGWEDYGNWSSDAEEDSAQPKNGHCSPSRRSSNSTQPKVELLRTAEALQSASQSLRVRYRHPCVHMILPNIPPEPQPTIARLLADIRATGTRVTHGSHEVASAATTAQSHPLDEILLAIISPHSLYQPPPTPTLNVDTSILIALLSDQCHHQPSTLPLRPSLGLGGPEAGSLQISTIANDTSTRQRSGVPATKSTSSYHAAIQAQMAQEEVRPLLPHTLYPLLAGRKLVCTTDAADRARSIVQTMGTESERARARILLDPTSEHDNAEQTPESSSPPSPSSPLEERWQALSSHPIPDDSSLQLPIEQVHVDVASLLTNAATTTSPIFPNEVATRLHTHLTHAQQPPFSALNASVLFHAWHAGIVTVTSNGLAVRAVEKGLNEVLDEMEDEGLGDVGADDGEKVAMPLFWLVEESRSLVGREKVE